MPFVEVLSSEFILQILEKQKTAFRDRVFSPIVTLTAFIAQVLSADHSCRGAVARVIAERIAQGEQPCSPGTGAYCQARQRLSIDLILQLLRAVPPHLTVDDLSFNFRRNFVA